MSHRNQLLSLRLLILLIALGAAFLLLSAKVSASPPEPEPRVYRVQSGDTLWAIAGSISGASEDVRSVIDDILDLNGLRDGSISVGQVLLLPVA